MLFVDLFSTFGGKYLHGQAGKNEDLWWLSRGVWMHWAAFYDVHHHLLVQAWLFVSCWQTSPDCAWLFHNLLSLRALEGGEGVSSGEKSGGRLCLSRSNGGNPFCTRSPA